ncbi:MAG: maleylpyruvate isomerase family mycothiol-dependent enzyme, partial [Candidatus Dormibacteria bacterium]
HSEDIRRPLGIHHRYSDEALTRTADFYRSSNLLIGAKRRADGLTLRADDVAWTAGSGPEVIGPLASIILAITGRRVGLDDLSGDGLATLRGRA